jgi:hypothetical protein
MGTGIQRRQAEVHMSARDRETLSASRSGRQNGRRKHHKVHRLVAKAFIPNPEGKQQVNHKDGNKQNNSITNLEWVTDEENKIHQKHIYCEQMYTD